MSLEESPQTQREVQKWLAAGAAQLNQEGKRSRERDSSLESDSGKVAPHTWGMESTQGDEDEDDFSSTSTSTQQPQIPTRNDGNEQPEAFEDSLLGWRDATHRAYWAELQNRLPLPLANLMEEEALEILTKSLQSYRKGIGKDHRLTQQLQRHVDHLSKNLKARQGSSAPRVPLRNPAPRGSDPAPLDPAPLDPAPSEK